MRRGLIWIATALAMAAGATHGATYSAVNDFSLTPTGPWSYGTGDSPTVSLFSNTHTGCFDTTGLECFNDDPVNEPVTPAVIKNTTNSDIFFAGGVDLPNNELLLHPGPGSTGSDTSVVFNAPMSGLYNISGLFERLSTLNDGNGVLVSIYESRAGGAATTLYSGSLTTLTYGIQDSFDLTGVSLSVGDQIDFAVNNNGEYTYDSTGLSASISTVPEIGGWALIMIGFASLGAALRGSRQGRIAPTA